MMTDLELMKAADDACLCRTDKGGWIFNNVDRLRALLASKPAVTEPTDDRYFLVPENGSYLVVDRVRSEMRGDEPDYCVLSWTTDKADAQFVCDAMNAASPATLERNELYTLRMAAITSAACGYWSEGDTIKPEYVTPALRDVSKLYRMYARQLIFTRDFREEVAALKEGAPAAPAQSCGDAEQADEAVTDTDRLDFMLANDAFTVRCNRDGSILQYQLMTQDEDENYHVLHDEHRFYNGEREAIDAAIGAAKDSK